jgi:RNA polymerase sigma-70 factor (ECF subfamily)
VQGNDEGRSALLGERLAAHERRLRLLLAHLAGRAVRARVEPDDLLQEVYLRALAPGSDVPAEEAGEAALGRFLARLARNTVVDVARAIRTRKRDGREVPLSRSDWSRAGPTASQLPAPARGPSTQVAAAEDQARLEAAFERLSPEHRRVIGLRQLEGLSARDAARRLGRSETAVHSLYRRALAAWEAEVR